MPHVKMCLKCVFKNVTLEELQVSLNLELIQSYEIKWWQWQRQWCQEEGGRMGRINRTVKVTSLPEQALSQSQGRAHQLTLGGLDDFSFQTWHSTTSKSFRTSMNPSTLLRYKENQLRGVQFRNEHLSVSGFALYELCKWGKLFHFSISSSVQAVRRHLPKRLIALPTDQYIG